MDLPQVNPALRRVTSARSYEVASERQPREKSFQETKTNVLGENNTVEPLLMDTSRRRTLGHVPSYIQALHL